MTTPPYKHNILTYFRLKLIALTLRLLIKLQGGGPLKRDRLLADTIPVTSQPLRIPTRGGLLDAVLYHPPSSSSSPPTPKKYPILINWHGSGWVLPLFGSDALFLKRVAQECNIFVLDADYRKGPEFPFPLPLQDVEDVLRWVGSGSHPLIDGERVAVSGFSAGAELALVASSVLRTTCLQDVGVDIMAVVAFYPETDLSLSLERKKVDKPIRPHPEWMLDFFHDCYVPDRGLRFDPAVSPSKAGGELFPEWVVMVTCEGDNFAPEALELAGRLRGSGRKGGVVVRNLEGVGHGFDKGCERGTKEWERREEAYGVVVRALKDVFK